MPKLKASEEFVVGKHQIGYISTDFKKTFSDKEFEVSKMPRFQKLGKNMNDAAIESELKPGLCTLGDVLAFIDNAPEECKDGWSNLFYFEAFVVDVSWNGGKWDVNTWHRYGNAWYTDYRVFSPATVASDPVPPALESSDTLPKMIKSIYTEAAIVIDGYAFIGGKWYKQV